MPRRSAPPDCDTRVETLLVGLRDSVQGGAQHWFVTVLQAVRDWPLAEEEVDGRLFRYLIGGEAFDWLLLAERLCETVADLTPDDEREALLLHARFPTEVTEEEFRRLLGPAKHRAHLNFLYGVQVEEALQLGVSQEVQKERLSKVWENGHVDEEVCQRIYGASRRELFERFRRQSGFPGEGLTLSDLHEFTYWLFKHRVNNSDPARVASDTRKGLAMLSRLRARRA